MMFNRYFEARLRRKNAPRKLGLKSLLRNEDGVSAVEFAFIAPLLVLIFFGCIELSLLMRADRRVTATAASLGDLTSRLASVSDDDMHELYNAAAVLMQPYSASDTRMRITSIVDSGDGQKKVAWSDGYKMTPRVVDSVVDVPSGIVPSPGSVILTEVEYDYRDGITVVIDSSMTLSDTFYLRPRRVSKIERITSGASSGAFGPTS
ncbi:pilus assembly protein [Hyphomonas sp. WL0036]|uniref:TadE/TadG family type IV pilus assembly protein n=1 Tax=Hyphomonas sediminis TaxID=2866160 RepID=UPI001C7E84AF|nr:TadE/TadG family type IV pilus assembly protein [Hyphomonas sediminis]MBY9066535.1 pilus assembly protein [Hyphomonas sediminis]